MIFSFIISFLSFYQIEFIGQLYITEIILLLKLVIEWKNYKILNEQLPKRILIFGLFWLFSQIVTDLIRGTSTADLMRGWASIVFFLIDFSAIYIIVKKNTKNIKAMYLGWVMGVIFYTLVDPHEFAVGEPWKFGYGLPVILLILNLTSNNYWARKRILVAFLMFILGILSIYLNARSLGIISIITGLLIFIAKKELIQTKIKHNFSVVTFILTVLFIYGIVNLYEYSAESGYLTEKVIEKYNRGKAVEFGILGNLIGGRFEILISTQAVIDSPIIGHGSWAANPKYSNMLYEVANLLDLGISQESLERTVDSSDLILTHSALMQAWVWAGLFGAIFWIYILIYITSTFYKSIYYYSVYQPLTIFISILSIWNILFSPFGSNARFEWALALIILFVYNADINKKENDKNINSNNFI